MTARTEPLGSYGADNLAGWQIVALVTGAAASSALAAAGLGPLAVAILPFAASVVLAVIGQATAWLWLLVVMSGVGLAWAQGSVVLGSWSINTPGLQWGLTFVLGSMLLVLLPPARVSMPRVFRWYAAFVVLAVIGVLRTPDLFEGVKHAIQYAAPLVVGLVTLRIADAPERVRTLRGALWLALAISMVVAVASLRWSAFTGDAPGLTGALGNRTYSIFLLPVLALALAAWHERGPVYALVVGAIFVLILLTLSRMVTAAAVVMMGTALMWRGTWASRLRALGVSGVLAALALSFGPLHDRFFDTPEGSVDVTAVGVTGEGREAQLTAGGLSLSGRGWLWVQTWQHARSAPVLGHGTGSAYAYLAAHLQFVTAHPHNDYLRVFHDSGGIGLLLLLATAVVGVLTLRRLYLQSGSVLGRELALAAFLSWAGYLMVALTDNIMVYVSFFTQNLFLLIALAHAVVEREPAATVAA